MKKFLLNSLLKKFRYNILYKTFQMPPKTTRTKAVDAEFPRSKRSAISIEKERLENAVELFYFAFLNGATIEQKDFFGPAGFSEARKGAVPALMHIAEQLEISDIDRMELKSKAKLANDFKELRGKAGVSEFIGQQQDATTKNLLGLLRNMDFGKEPPKEQVKVKEPTIELHTPTAPPTPAPTPPPTPKAPTPETQEELEERAIKSIKSRIGEGSWKEVIKRGDEDRVIAKEIAKMQGKPKPLGKLPPPEMLEDVPPQQQPKQKGKEPAQEEDAPVDTSATGQSSGATGSGLGGRDMGDGDRQRAGAAQSSAKRQVKEGDPTYLKDTKPIHYDREKPFRSRVRDISRQGRIGLHYYANITRPTNILDTGRVSFRNPNPFMRI
jgi:hypothetical protein